MSDRIEQVIDEKRHIHPELGGPLAWTGLTAILQREGIRLVRTPMSRPAALIANGDVSVLMLNSDIPARRHTYFAAHELGHAWLHADQEGELCAFVDFDWRKDPREDEAEWFAMLVLRGPQENQREPVTPSREIGNRVATVESLRTRIQSIVGPAPIAPPPRFKRSLAPLEPLGYISANSGEGMPCDVCALDHAATVSYRESTHILPHRGCNCARGCRCMWLCEGSEWH